MKLFSALYAMRCRCRSAKMKHFDSTLVPINHSQPTAVAVGVGVSAGVNEQDPAV